MLSIVRRFFAIRHVLEVETPCLGQTTGTEVHLNFFSTDLLDSDAHQQQKLFLQTSPEFAMKRLLAAGSGSIYQICKAFRNCEHGPVHNPEFTLLEWYRVGFDLNQLMDEIETLMLQLFDGSSVTLGTSERISYQEVFLRFTGIDIFKASIPDFVRSAKNHGLAGAFDLCQDEISVWLDYMFSHLVQPHLGRDNLTFIYDYPACQCAMARKKPGVPEVAQRLEVFVNGIELANGYYELVEPNEQKQRFRRELQERDKRGLPLPKLDNRFLQALEFGLPECSGVAIGLDRALMLLSGVSCIDDVLAFPISSA